MAANEIENEESIPLSLLRNQKRPIDKLKLVYVFFYIIGVATLLPWNFFITAKDYFSYKFRNTTIEDINSCRDHNDCTYLQKTYLGYLSVASMVPNILFQFLNTLLSTKISVNIRVTVSVIIMILSFIITVVFAQISTDKWQIIFFLVTLVTLVVVSACSAVFQGGIFGLASMFPGRYTQSIMGGMGLGGVVAAISNIIVLLLDETPEQTATFFFLIATAILTLSLVIYLLLPHINFSTFYIALNEETVSLSRSGSRASLGNYAYEDTSKETIRPDDVTFSDLADEMGHWNVFSFKGPIAIVFKEIWVLASTVVCIFFVTLSLFPTIIARIVSVDNKVAPNIWNGKLFIPIICFFLFNVGDLIGRMLPGWVMHPGKRSIWLPILAVLRIGFIPLFMMCNVQPRNSSLPVIFNSDVWPIGFITLLAISNGYLSTLAMMYAPTLVPQEHLETAGAMMSFFLSVGLGCGSLLSLALQVII